MNPVQPVTSTFTTTVHQEESNNRITINCRSLCMHARLLGRSVLGRSTGRVEPEMLLTLILLTWRIWWAPNNANIWQIGFNSAFKGLKLQVVLSPVRLSPGRSKTGTGERGLVHHLGRIWFLRICQDLSENMTQCMS